MCIWNDCSTNIVLFGTIVPNKKILDEMPKTGYYFLSRSSEPYWIGTNIMQLRSLESSEQLWFVQRYDWYNRRTTPGAVGKKGLVVEWTTSETAWKNQSSVPTDTYDLLDVKYFPIIIPVTNTV
jgi:hypothetical protein